MGSFWRRWRSDAGIATPDAPPDPGQSRILVDANTHTFWARGALQPATLVEAGDVSPENARRTHEVRALVAAHEGRTEPERPRGNPAFSEALFVELMRAEQYQRAFNLLSPECQRTWGSLDRFAEAHRDGSMRSLRGVNVTAVRHLDSWTDPETGVAHDSVAELDVEYAVAAGGRTTTVRRTVHLVAVEGRWRSLCYPAA